jgi:glycosyltransferase involved in cell wall biosynthesis
MRICICATQVPFSHGGAEIHVEGLRAELERRGFEVSVVTLPFASANRLDLIKSGLAWRLVNLETADGLGEIDLVIATRFPSYVVRHPNKVVWLIHQYRQAYDLLNTAHSDFSHSADDRLVLDQIRSMDRRALGEARALFTNSRNTAARLKQFNGFEATPLYPPPGQDGAYRCGEFGDYILGVGRLDRLKRFDLLIRAMQHTTDDLRCLIAGEGAEREALQALIDQLGLQKRVRLLGWVSDAELLDRYADALAVYFAPYDEDFGYVTLEAFKSSKPVITAQDSGGVLEFVIDDETGFVCASNSPAAFAVAFDKLFASKPLARRLGQRGQEAVSHINWEHVITSLTGL